jgi:EthD domain
MKFMSLISRGPGQENAAFHQWFVAEGAPAIVQQSPRLSHYIVNVNDVSPNFGDSQPLRTAPVPYDVVTEMWIEPANAAEGAAELYRTALAPAMEQSLRARSAVCHSYLIADVVEKDAQKFAAGQRAPGVNLVSAITWGEGKTGEQGRQGWRNHGPLACRVHIGMTRYVRNVIEQAVTAGAPPYNGIAMLYFPTIADLEQRLYDIPANVEVIGKDVAGFVNLEKIVTFYTGQYVIK